MNHKLVVWLAVTLASLAVGGVFGFVFALSWFLLCLVFLGYGDSGPSWINTVSDTVFSLGVFVGVIGGQMLFFIKVRRQSASSVTDGDGADIREDCA